MVSKKSPWKASPYWVEWLNDWLIYKTEVSLAKKRSSQHRLQFKTKLVERALRANGSDHPRTSFRKKGVADTLEEMGRLDEARSMRREHLDACRRNVGPDHHWTLTAELRLAENLAWSGDPAGARDLARHVLAVRHLARGTDKTEANRAAALLDTLGETDT
jgi:hypothetical protein